MIKSRLVWMIAATIILLPLIMVFEVWWFIYVYVKTKDIEETVRIWYDYLIAGLNRNKDFIINGF